MLIARSKSGRDFRASSAQATPAPKSMALRSNHLKASSLQGAFILPRPHSFENLSQLLKNHEGRRVFASMSSVAHHFGKGQAFTLHEPYSPRELHSPCL